MEIQECMACVKSAPPPPPLGSRIEAHTRFINDDKVVIHDCQAAVMLHYIFVQISDGGIKRRLGTSACALLPAAV